MATIEYYSNIDLKGNEIKNVVIDKLSGAPTVSTKQGQIVSYDGDLYIASTLIPQGETNEGKYSYVKLATGGDTTTLQTKLENVGTAIGYDATASSTGYVDNSTGLSGRLKTVEDSLGTSGDTASTSGTTAWSQIKAKQNALTAGNGISIGTVSDVDNTIYLPDQANVTAGEYGSGTSIPKLTVNKQGTVTKTDSVTVYPPTTAGTAGQVWTSQGSGVGTWTTIAATSMTAKSSDASKTEIPSSYAVQSAIDTAVTGAYKVKGSKTVDQLNGTGEEAVTTKVQGDVYNVSTSGTLSAGSVVVVAGDNVVWDGTQWDKLAATVNISYPVTDVTVGGTSCVSNTVAALGVAAGKGVDTSTLNSTDDTTVPSSKLVGTSLAGKMDKFGTTPTAANKVVVTLADDADSLSYLAAAVGGSKQPIYVNSTGQLTATTENLGSATKPIYLSSGTFTEGTALADAAYLGKEVQGSSDTVTITADDTKVPTSKAVLFALGEKVNANAALPAGATKCKITYDTKGLVTGGADLEASDIPTLSASKISDFASAARTAMSGQFVDIKLNAASGVAVSGNTYTITTASKAYGVMVLDKDSRQVFVDTVVNSDSIVVDFGSAITASEFTVSYILKTNSA